jgi:gamma-glutamyltranspeptidase
VQTPVHSGIPEAGSTLSPFDLFKGAEMSMHGYSVEEPKISTTHLCIVVYFFWPLILHVDAWGNVVSMTTTIERNLGSAVVVPRRGFLLNNELTDFSALVLFRLLLPHIQKARDSDGRHLANAPAGGKRLRRTALGPDKYTLGGKRPMSSMSP